MTNEKTALTASGEAIPAEFLARMRDMLGEDFDAFCASFSHALAPSLRVNPLKGDADAVREALPYLGDPVPWQAAGFYYPAPTEGAEDAPRPGKHPLHEAGLYYIQEASAMLPPLAFQVDVKWLLSPSQPRAVRRIILSIRERRSKAKRWREFLQD